MRSPFGPITWRAVDHQSTMGAYVGQLAKKERQGHDGELALRRRREVPAAGRGNPARTAPERRPDASSARPAAVPQRARGRELAVPGRRRAVAHLRRHPHRQLRARLAVHAGHVPRRVVSRSAWASGLRVPLAAADGGAARPRGRECFFCDASTARPSCCSCSPPSRSCSSSGLRAVGLGAGGHARAARAGAARRRRDRRPRVPAVRPAADRARPAGLRRAAPAADAHALGHAGARRHRGPRDGRRARREPEAGSSPAVFALGAALAGSGGALQIPREPASLEIDLAVDLRCVRRSWSWAASARSRAPSSPRCSSARSRRSASAWATRRSRWWWSSSSWRSVLVLRPWGLLGRPQAVARGPAAIQPMLEQVPARAVLALALLIGVLAALVPPSPPTTRSSC